MRRSVAFLSRMGAVEFSDTAAASVEATRSMARDQALVALIGLVEQRLCADEVVLAAIGRIVAADSSSPMP